MCAPRAHVDDPHRGTGPAWAPPRKARVVYRPSAPPRTLARTRTRRPPCPRETLVSSWGANHPPTPPPRTPPTPHWAPQGCRYHPGCGLRVSNHGQGGVARAASSGAERRRAATRSIPRPAPPAICSARKDAVAVQYPAAAGGGPVRPAPPRLVCGRADRSRSALIYHCGWGPDRRRSGSGSGAAGRGLDPCARCGLPRPTRESAVSTTGQEGVEEPRRRTLCGEEERVTKAGSIGAYGFAFHRGQ